ncbi:MAG: RlmE family RNA methyltransferase [Desulfobacteraceae bacterium]|nr:RlmE family RNA methyltransferase [Desulfobacteraceae bacterium]
MTRNRRYKKRPSMPGKRWQDHYTRRAQRENYPARSVFKLREIQQRHRILKEGDAVLDLGCSPGSWLLYAARCVGTSGAVLGIDRKPVSVELPAHVEAVVGDVFEPPAAVLQRRFHALISDMAPDTTGSAVVDVARSEALAEMALHLAGQVLHPGGSFVCKVFQGQGFQKLVQSVRTAFDAVAVFKPKSSRKASRELYIIGKGKR